MTDGISSIRSIQEEAGLGGGEAVARALARLHAEGRAAWPDLALPVASLVRHVARHVADKGAAEALVAAIHAADFYLACACHERIRGSAEALRARYEAEVDAALRSRKVPPAHRDELRQMLWEKLLVGRPGTPPKIGDYAGRGPLGGWMRVAAVRAALNFLEQVKSDRLVVGEEIDDARHPSTPDPELAFLKAHYRVEVQRALKDALESLETDERNVLRLHVLDGLSIDRIAAVYGVHRATAARWVTRGREALLRGTRELLEKRLRIDQAEVESILDVVRSQISLSPSALFRPAGP
ncbi:sigma-70 family RNA polymerase sigma factor [Polyangium aurulentum]|uniref:sigma-70 family RNA polymerase sigma factor n=1 Tax=Polyangium aurulentum TaxID=2567896 RepID=UPI0010ADB56E|nr:sigma-70 family RNA polymerase sigma factor [Polyangium aurulentum]UQA58737.1 sigma-70 family RNA polymerase sigma factor [Polyangium aurulentum]